MLYHGKSLPRWAGAAPAVLAGDFESGRWLVPVDSMPRVLGRCWRRAWTGGCRARAGDRERARAEDRRQTFVSGDTVRVVLEASETVPFQVLQEEGRVTVAIPRDLVSVAFQQQRLTGGIVDGVQFLGGRDNVFAVSLGRRFQRMTASEQAAPARLVMEFQAAPLTVASPPPGDVPGAGLRPAAPADRGGIRTVVIDPGHGGAEVGAQGPGGTLEKDVTLAIGRKVRSALANNLGLQAFLTRDKDQEVALDDRTAFANNYKADLFVSIHANASAARGARGSEVYFLSYQASDEESRRLAQSEGGAIAPGTAAFGGTSDLALILWDMAQAEHLEESSALATRINEELAEVTGSQGRGIKQAPVRVLVGAGMPAVLVEIAFISTRRKRSCITSDGLRARWRRRSCAAARALSGAGPAVASTWPARDLETDRERARRQRPGRRLLVLLLGIVSPTAPRGRAGCGARYGAGPRGSRRRAGGRAGAPSRQGPDRKISVKLFFPAGDRAWPGDRGPHRVLLRRPVAAAAGGGEELARGSQMAWAPASPGHARPRGVRDRARGGLRGPSKEAASPAVRADPTTSSSPCTRWSLAHLELPSAREAGADRDRGRQVPTLAGHVDLTRPLGPDLTYLATSTVTPAASPAPPSAPPS